MEHIVGAGLVIGSGKDVLIVADIVEGRVFGGVHETAGAGSILREELPPLTATETQIAFLTNGPERAVFGGKTAMRLLSEPRASNRSYHERGLIAVLGRGSSINRFHGLNSVQRNLRREEVALLVGDGLVVDGKTHLGVIAK